MPRAMGVARACVCDVVCAARTAAVVLVCVGRLFVAVVAVMGVLVRFVVRVLARVVRGAGVAVVEVGFRLLLGLELRFGGLRLFS